MKIVTLIENSLGHKPDLICEHGLSIFIETPNCNILFDTGKSGDFIKNADDLQIDLNNTDYIVMSHAHYDHCNGLKSFVENFSARPKICVSEHFFSNSTRYHNSSRKIDLSFEKDEEYKYIGINFDESFLKENSFEIDYLKSDKTELTDGIYLFTNFKRHYDFETLNTNMVVKSEDEFRLDEFKDEVVLGLDTTKGLLLLLGCSHIGVLNIIKSIENISNKKVFGILGGTHLIEADSDRIKSTIEGFKDLGVHLIGASHCTGQAAIEELKLNFDNFFVNSTGSMIVY